jgi:hypothetical protein
MQNPEKELPDVVNLVTAAINPEVQKAAVQRYLQAIPPFLMLLRT